MHDQELLVILVWAPCMGEYHDYCDLGCTFAQKMQTDCGEKSNMLLPGREPGTKLCNVTGCPQRLDLMSNKSITNIILIVYPSASMLYFHALLQAELV
jgi:hypothetical protein